MIVTKKWVAAGSTATLLAGGLFFGAPMASAAPGDAACLQASTQFNAALGAAGVDVNFVNQFEAVTAEVVVAAENLFAVSASLNLDALILAAEEASDIAAQAQLDVEEAQIAVDAAVALATEEDVDGDGDPENDQRVIDARAALAAAADAETVAVNASLAATAAAEAALADPALIAAEAELEAVSLEADALLAQLSGDEALAAELLALFKAFLVACDASAIGVDPVTPTPVVNQAPTVTPTGTNRGLNVQTAVPVKDDSSAVALIAALLAVGVAVPVATAARMRRLERAQD